MDRWQQLDIQHLCIRQTTIAHLTFAQRKIPTFAHSTQHYFPYNPQDLVKPPLTIWLNLRTLPRDKGIST